MAKTKRGSVETRTSITERRSVPSPIRLVQGAVAAALFVTGLATSAVALDRSTTDPRKIAEAVEARDDGNRRVATMAVAVRDAAGRTRKLSARSYSLDFDEGSKTLILFERPADVRGTGLLSIDYDDGSKDDDQWIYLPSVHRSTRISTSGKSGSFMGTDITYADMTRTDTKQYDYTMVSPSEKVDGDDCWVIEQKPRSKKVQEETGYLKTRSWISKDKLMPLQAKAWVAKGKKLKYMKFRRVEKVDGIWVANELAVRLLRGGKVESESVVRLSDVHFNQESVTPALFTKRRLERGL